VHKVRSHKTVEDIANKHRLDVSFVKNQLKMGIPIEHEHTKDKDLATDIALQHLDEIPDYYTRLKKMESDAKKEHKKISDVKEETASGDQGLHDWFNKSKSKNGTKGWVQLGGKWSGKPCARQPGQESTPKCGSSKMKRDLSKKEEETARRRKNRLDPNQPEKSGAAKPTNVRTEEMNLQEVKDRSIKGSGTKDACYRKVKSRYSVWPSAYASGALSRCRKVGSKNWGTKTEEVQMLRYCPKCQKDETRDECKYGQKFWDMYSMPVNLKGYHPNSPHPGNFPESYDHEYSMARSELSTIASAVKRLKKKMKGEGNIEAWVQSKITKAADYIDTAADYVDSGEMKEQVKPVGDETEKYGKFSRRVNAAMTISNPQTRIKILKSASKLYPKPVDEGMSFEINPEEHKKKKRERKIRELERRTTSEGEREAAKSKLKGPELPPIRESYGYSNWRSEFGLSEQTKYVMPNASRPGYAGGGSKAYRVGEMIPASATKPSREALFQQSLEKVGKNLRQKPFNEDWQKINRHDRTDGLSQKAVDAYRREHPGSKLQTAVTEKNPKGKRAKRRVNFCRRMKGARSKLTSAKTARDPNSNINKALRRWRCH
jgi:hypothetical protein